MNATKGYFCLVQYCPDIARHEAANVGVVLFCPDLRFMDVKMIKANHRIRRFFGEEADNYQHLNAMKEALANRIEIEREEFKTLADLQGFVATRANKVILTEPKPIKVFDPSADLEALYRELVLEPARLVSQPSLPLRLRLDAALMDTEVRRYVQTNIKVQVPNFEEAHEIPYGYKNGRFNLIQPIEFTQQSAARMKSAAARYAMEGLSLFKHADPVLGPLKLVVVAEFPEQSDTIIAVSNILKEGEVDLFTSEDLDVLKREIVEHGTPLVKNCELFQ